MTEAEMEQAIIRGLLQHQVYRVIGAQYGWSEGMVQCRVSRLLRRYSARDRYELEYRLREFKQ